MSFARGAMLEFLGVIFSAGVFLSHDSHDSVCSGTEP